MLGFSGTKLWETLQHRLSGVDMPSATAASGRFLQVSSTLRVSYHYDGTATHLGQVFVAARDGGSYDVLDSGRNYTVAMTSYMAADRPATLEVT